MICISILFVQLGPLRLTFSEIQKFLFDMKQETRIQCQYISCRKLCTFEYCTSRLKLRLKKKEITVPMTNNKLLKKKKSFIITLQHIFIFS